MLSKIVKNIKSLGLRFLERISKSILSAVVENKAINRRLNPSITIEKTTYKIYTDKDTFSGQRLLIANAGDDPENLFIVGEINQVEGHQVVYFKHKALKFVPYLLGEGHVKPLHIEVGGRKQKVYRLSHQFLF